MVQRVRDCMGYGLMAKQVRLMHHNEMILLLMCWLKLNGENPTFLVFF
ncbi:hypothetical protein Lalb_Chr12g0207361 [Lupinus albus]|uniref:Uncharacterized protein n=1 Tax=Lupinus albus TaxID=3870 RepID=A0A6A4PNH7_LUPAL|nr:hypothetical protein Lalb_Chr12g0207361 [Lupinus albus]